MLCHPDAKKFRENFKAHREELTTILYKLFNEKAFDNKMDVDIIWNKKLATTAGRFHGRKKYVYNQILLRKLNIKIWNLNVGQSN